MTIQELKERMYEAQQVCEKAINTLQNNDVEVIDVSTERIETTKIDDDRRRYLWRVKIETKIVTH